jgi:hypothetical protein
MRHDGRGTVTIHITRIQALRGASELWVLARDRSDAKAQATYEKAASRLFDLESVTEEPPHSSKTILGVGHVG